MRKVPEGIAILSVRGDVPGAINGLHDAVRLVGEWVREAGHRINRTLPADGSEAMGAPLRLRSYLAAALPPAADHEGAIIYVSDGAAGTRFRGSNGSAWVNLG